MSLLLNENLNIRNALSRIKNYLHLTPVIQSEILNEMLGHKIYFKAECLQKTGAFKVRGVLNHLLVLQEQNSLPAKIVAYSTGNHGMGLAWAAKKLGTHARIYLPKNTSLVKQKAAKYYGAEVIYTETRKEAEELCKADSEKGYYYMHPSDSDLTIAGAGTLCFEALTQLPVQPDAIFGACGGGGLLSGTYLAKEQFDPEILVFGVEPKVACDAFYSLTSESIFRFQDSPNTVADGLRTLSISPRTLNYLKLLDGFYLVEEKEIYYWTAWLIHLLKITVEPSCALNMQAVCEWLKKQDSKKNVLVLISGGNIDPSFYRDLWKEDHLLTAPSIRSILP